MLELTKIRQEKEEIIARLKVKNFQKAEEIVELILLLDIEKRQVQKELEDLKAQTNAKSKEIGSLMAQNQKEKAQAIKEEVSQIKEKTKELEIQLKDKEEKILNNIILLPNLPHSSVPLGKSAEDNEEVFKHGDIPQLPSNALPHWELCQKYDIIDFDLGSKITGAGFPVYKGKGAKLQRALINFFLEEANKAGFTEIQAPLMVNEDSAYATGQLPDKDSQMYVAKEDNFYLIPTAEVPLTNMFRDQILKESELPIKVCGYTPCFRREAGSYGKDVRGLNRLHQFDKIEIVCVQTPENSYAQLEEMKLHVQNLLIKLQLPFRILRLCGGDMSFTSALTFDFETYSAAQQRWLEVSSVSNFETFQANRLKLRYRNQEGKINLAHTLNGSALALPRIVATLLENNQTDEGIIIPSCLQPYTGFDRID